MSNNFDNAQCIEVVNRAEIQKIEHVHFGVFFDGTNNNMVQQAYFHTLKNKKHDISVSDDKSLSRQNVQYEEFLNIVKQRNEKNAKLTALLVAQETSRSPVPDFSINYKKIISEIEDLEKKMEKMQAITHIDDSTLESDTERGYSNIAILHSLLNECHNTSNAVFYNLYIEGSGATDISSVHERNINGLGFGLGKTGVTALVSKAVKYVHLYLTGVSSMLSDETCYHFYVFGFSRGATCARLFSELTTRDVGKKMDREYEFGQDTSKAKDLYDKKNERLPFMERHFLKQKIINREKVTVDFLGIYDTVASIGFLRQKDGWTNSLSLAYTTFWWNNYHGNFHYMNAHDYGLYSPKNKRVLHTCHICAGDEYRENFALVNLGTHIPKTSMEIVIPGCHSDVGGGYVTENSMDFVLYKFIPRKLERFIKHNKISEIVFFPYLLSKERATMFVHNPMNVNQTEELNAETLAKLGWIGNEWRGGELEVCKEDNKPYTLRVAEWPNEVKFKRYALKGYSNIPLQMMKLCVEKCGITWLFKKDNIPFAIPDDLKELGGKMLSYINVPQGQRLWLIPNGDYSGEKYRGLRLRYLHFTSSCELWHLRSNVKKENMRKVKERDKEEEPWYHIGEVNLANFGNNCNYDSCARICRIMYNGDEELPNKNDYKEHIHYMYEFDSCGMHAEEI